MKKPDLLNFLKRKYIHTYIIVVLLKRKILSDAQSGKNYLENEPDGYFKIFVRKSVSNLYSECFSNCMPIFNNNNQSGGKF